MKAKRIIVGSFFGFLCVCVASATAAYAAPKKVTVSKCGGPNVFVIKPCESLPDLAMTAATLYPEKKLLRFSVQNQCGVKSGASHAEIAFYKAKEMTPANYFNTISNIEIPPLEPNAYYTTNFDFTIYEWLLPKNYLQMTMKVDVNYDDEVIEDTKENNWLAVNTGARPFPVDGLQHCKPKLVFVGS